MARSRILIAFLLLVASAATAWIVSTPSCFGMYRARNRAVPVDAKVMSVDQRVIKTRTSRRVTARTNSRTVEDLQVVATWQGREISRSVSENHKGAKMGETRTILVDPEDPDLDIPQGPAWFNFVPGAVVSAGLALGALSMLFRGRRLRLS